MSLPASFNKDALTVLITGANRGIGLALAAEFRRNGYNVIGTSRRIDAESITELSKVANAVFQLDVTNEKETNGMADALKAAGITYIDILINNAGTYLTARNLDDTTSECFVETFRVNSIGPFLVTRSLLPLLRSSPNRGDRRRAAKVIQITSRMGSIEDADSGGNYAYRASKAALNMITKSLSIDLPDIGFMVLHPGYIKTRMTGGGGDMTPEEAAKRMYQRVVELDCTKGCQFMHRDGKVLPW